MIDNCNHSGHLPSNVDCATNGGDIQSNSENAAGICDTNRVKSVIEKLDKNNKRMNHSGGGGGGSDGGSNNSINGGKSPTLETLSVPATDDHDTECTTIQLSIDDELLNDDVGKDAEANNNTTTTNANSRLNEVVITSDTNECAQLDNFPSYSTFENDFKRRINELNSSRSDAQTHGILFGAGGGGTLLFVYSVAHHSISIAFEFAMPSF